MMFKENIYYVTGVALLTMLCWHKVYNIVREVEWSNGLHFSCRLNLFWRPYTE